MAQLPLELKLKAHASFDAFVAGANLTAAEHVRSVAVGDRSDCVWVYGPKSTGKSHLLAAACRAASEKGQRAIYLSPDSVAEPEMLRQLEDTDFVALDDAQRVAGDPEWEQALFSLFNARLQKGGLVVAATAAPRETGFMLDDLVSRAGAAATYRLEYLDDEDLRAAAQRHATMRGLSLEPAALSYLLQRVSRDLAELTGLLDRIDRYALAAKRKITIPLLREVMST
ncbi:MAG TPA: DnaA regulatory inactivator Hda [Gammaproteobacteria bacterium]